MALFALLLAAVCRPAQADDLFVDPLQGNDHHPGTFKEPFATLAKGVSVANASTGDGPITIKLYPGLYVLTGKVSVKPVRARNQAARYTIEALTMPDDKDWSPDKMPVIQSVSANNSTEQFPHSVGILVAASNVSIRGVKFVGNPNPAVKYYYPITKDNESLRGMEVSQCYFIAEKHSAPIQGGIWAHGPDTDINHCVFYQCRNAILLFKSVTGFSITHTVMYGADESAIWMGPIESGFVFRNNVVAKSRCFWVRPENSQPAYEFSDCLVTETDTYMGYYARGVVAMPGEKNSRIKETKVVKSGAVKLVEKTNEVLPREYLNLTPDSAGYGLGAGIFRTKPAK
jgi:hypothetical protein